MPKPEKPFRIRLTNPWIGELDLDRSIPFRLGEKALEEHEIIDERGHVRDTRVGTR